MCHTTTTVTETASDGSWKIITSPLDDSTLRIGSGIFASVLLLYAMNGLRIVRFSAGNVSMETLPETQAQHVLDDVKSVDPSADEPVDPKTPPPESTAAPEIVRTAKGPFEYYRLPQVPARVLHDAIAGWPLDDPKPTDFTGFEVALRKTGRGNHPWILKFRDRVPIAVSYGGQGKGGSTVTKA